ncbi:MAG: hypothetical protein Rubg2KO_34240 [Rubricoccaceae bacterium]
MAPDAIPVRALASVATLPPDAVQHLFGASSSLRGSERLALIQLGQVRAHVSIQPGMTLSLQLDRLDASSTTEPSGLRLQGPVGVLTAPSTRPVQSVLTVPEGLKAAWRMGDEATLGLGPLAVRVPVNVGNELAIHVERALWLGAGSPKTARWLPQTDWSLEPDPEEAQVDPRIAIVAGRVVTETDVRQARLRRQRIQLAPGQIVTPAARSLAREWNVFESSNT